MQLVGWVCLVRVAGREGLFAASGVGPSCESGREVKDCLQLVGWVHLVRVARREGLFAASGVGLSCESGREGRFVCS